MIKTEAFKPEHLVNIKREDIDSQMLDIMGDLDGRAFWYAKSGPAVTMLEDEVILCVGGIVWFWSGVGEAWLLVSPEGRKRKVALLKVVRAFLDNRTEFHRIQASIMYGNARAHKTAMLLGFIPEGMMVRYGPNKENYVRYVRV